MAKHVAGRSKDRPVHGRGARGRPNPSASRASTGRKLRGKARPHPPRHSTTRPDPLAKERARTACAVAMIALLFGVTIGLVISGLGQAFGAPFEGHGLPGATVPHVAFGVAVLLLAMGVFAPHRVADWMCLWAWRRFSRGGRSSPLAGVLLFPEGPDRSLQWTFLAVVCLTTGALAALLPILVRAALAAVEYMCVHFLWSHVSLSVLQALTVFAAGLPALACIGLAISCVHRMGFETHAWTVSTTGWLMVGSAVGAATASMAPDAHIPGGVLLLAGSLPIFACAVVSAAPSLSRSLPTSTPAPACHTVPFTEISGLCLALQRAGVLALGGVSAWTGQIWITRGPGGSAWASARAAGVLTLIGTGLLIGSLVRRTTPGSIGGFGLASVAAGVAVGATSIAVVQDTRETLLLQTFAMCASLLALGFATAHGWQGLLRWVTNPSKTGADLLAHVLLLAALIVWIIEPAATWAFGPGATLILIGLCVTTLGGALIIHEPRYSPRTQRVRLVAVFASLAVMMTVAWLTPGWWSRRPVSAAPSGLAPTPHGHDRGQRG